MRYQGFCERVNADDSVYGHMQVFKFAVYLAVPFGLTAVVVLSPSNLKALIENVRTMLCSQVCTYDGPLVIYEI